MKYIFTDIIMIDLPYRSNEIKEQNIKSDKLLENLKQFFAKAEKNNYIGYQVRNYIQEEAEQGKPVLEAPLCYYLPPAIRLNITNKDAVFFDLIDFEVGDKIIYVDTYENQHKFIEYTIQNEFNQKELIEILKRV